MRAKGIAALGRGKAMDLIICPRGNPHCVFIYMCVLFTFSKILKQCISTRDEAKIVVNVLRKLLS